MNDSHERLLLDTSAWVRCLRRWGAEDLKEAVASALTQMRIATCWVVKMEVLVGSRDTTAFDALADRFSGIPDVPITEAVWADAAMLGYSLRRVGVLVAVPDLVIAQCAIASGRILWHSDGDFELIRPLSSLRTRDWRTAG